MRCFSCTLSCACQLNLFGNLTDSRARARCDYFAHFNIHETILCRADHVSIFFLRAGVRAIRWIYLRYASFENSIARLFPASFKISSAALIARLFVPRCFQVSLWKSIESVGESETGTLDPPCAVTLRACSKASPQHTVPEFRSFFNDTYALLRYDSAYLQIGFPGSGLRDRIKRRRVFGESLRIFIGEKLLFGASLVAT